MLLILLLKPPAFRTSVNSTKPFLCNNQFKSIQTPGFHPSRAVPVPPKAHFCPFEVWIKPSQERFDLLLVVQLHCQLALWKRGSHPHQDRQQIMQDMAVLEGQEGKTAEDHLGTWAQTLAFL